MAVNMEINSIKSDKGIVTLILTRKDTKDGDITNYIHTFKKVDVVLVTAIYEGNRIASLHIKLKQRITLELDSVSDADYAELLSKLK